MTWNHWIAIGCICAGLGIAAGAFGGHALKVRLTPEELAIYETAVRYQMYHAFGLFLVGFLYSKISSNAVTVGGFAFLLGIICFSGSLYALVLLGKRELGMLTPVGGVAFIIGWIALVIGAFRP